MSASCRAPGPGADCESESLSVSASESSAFGVWSGGRRSVLRLVRQASRGFEQSIDVQSTRNFELALTLRLAFTLALALALAPTLSLFALCPVSADAGLFGNRGPASAYLAISESSAAQQSDVQAQMQRLNAALQAGTRHGPNLRYIALPTLNPTKAQIEAYLERRGEAEAAAAARRRKLARTWVDPSRLHCLMVWDLQSNSLVTRNCYLVGSLPDIGTASKFEDVTAEFAGQQ